MFNTSVTQKLIPIATLATRPTPTANIADPKAPYATATFVYIFINDDLLDDAGNINFSDTYLQRSKLFAFNSSGELEFIAQHDNTTDLLFDRDENGNVQPRLSPDYQTITADSTQYTADMNEFTADNSY